MAAATQFLNDKQPVTATYTANITSSEGSIEFKLGGNLTFVVATED